MKKRFVCLLLATPLLLAAQITAPEGFEHWTSADLGRVGQALSADAAADPHHFAVKIYDNVNSALAFVGNYADSFRGRILLCTDTTHRESEEDNCRGCPTAKSAHAGLPPPTTTREMNVLC